jgi:hypothetical protein
VNTLQVGANSGWLIHAAAATILFLHIAGGAFGIVSGMAALAVRKGRRLHALAGRVFFVSMLVMASIGALVAPFLVALDGSPKWFDSIAGYFTFYLVATGWMTVRRKAGTIGRFEVAAFVYAATLAAMTILLGMRAAGLPGGATGGMEASAYYGLGTVIALAAALDLKVILGGGIAGSSRLARHLWRMCLACFVAVGSFFLGQQRVMPELIQGSPWLQIPPLVPLAMMMFWLLRLRLAKLAATLKRRLRRRQAGVELAPAAGQ